MMSVDRTENMKIVPKHTELDRRVLLRTEVGSHMWRMATPQSDHDFFEIFLFQTKHILIGCQPKSVCKHNPELGVDLAAHEFGEAIHQLIKGNINFITGVNSPLLTFIRPDIELLRRSPELYLSKRIGDSLFGMVDGNIGKYMRIEGKDTPRWTKLMRYLRFAEHLATDLSLRFEPCEKTWYDQLIEERKRIRELFYKSTVLPDNPSGELALWELLLQVRIRDLGAD